MASYSPILLLLVVVSLWPAATLSQDTAAVAQCVPRLLPLATCGPFVQGAEQAPGQPCCDNLKQIYGQQPRCLCLLLSDPTALSSLPPMINTSLALQLPALCSLLVDISVCSAGVNGPISPGSQSQASLGSTVPANSSSSVNSTITASPVFQTVPIPSSNATAQVLDKSGVTNFQIYSDFAVLIAVALSTSVLILAIF